MQRFEIANINIYINIITKKLKYLLTGVLYFIGGQWVLWAVDCRRVKPSLVFGL